MRPQVVCVQPPLFFRPISHSRPSNSRLPPIAAARARPPLQPRERRPDAEPSGRPRQVCPRQDLAAPRISPCPPRCELAGQADLPAPPPGVSPSAPRRLPLSLSRFQGSPAAAHRSTWRSLRPARRLTAPHLAACAVFYPLANTEL